MNGTEFVGSAVWKVVYEHCWSKWMMGLDVLRKAANGVEAARGKEMMTSAEDALRIPLRHKEVVWGNGEDSAYKNGLTRMHNGVCKEMLGNGVMPENKKE
jgi:hypothetical protein